MNRRPEALDDAWKIHAALVDWTGKVDTKAAFALTLESAFSAGIITLAGSGRVFGTLSGSALGFFRLGGAFLAIALIFALLVTTPRLRTRHLEAEFPSNWIYFGHLRSWDDEALTLALSDTDPLPVVSRQLIAMSKIAWSKHRRVQLSFVAAFLAGACYFLASFLR